ncbi:MAG: hypothetical protein AAGI06_09365 [Pseudomonadota bacterium]
MRSKSVDADLLHLQSMLKECSGLARDKNLNFLDYLLGMARLEVDNIAASQPPGTQRPSRQLEPI